VCKDRHAETPDGHQCLGENVRSVQCMAVYRTTMSLNITCLHIIDWLQSVTLIGLGSNNLLNYLNTSQCL
jgi:hypothetical protein